VAGIVISLVQRATDNRRDRERQRGTPLPIVVRPQLMAPTLAFLVVVGAGDAVLAVLADGVDLVLVGAGLAVLVCVGRVVLEYARSSLFGDAARITVTDWRGRQTSRGREEIVRARWGRVTDRDGARSSLRLFGGADEAPAVEFGSGFSKLRFDDIVRFCHVLGIPLDADPARSRWSS